jgi:hypothetical protein
VDSSKATRRAPQDCTGKCGGHAGDLPTVIGIHPGAKAGASDVNMVAELLDRATSLDYRNQDGTEPLFQIQLRKVIESGKHIDIVVLPTFTNGRTVPRGPWQNSAIGASDITVYYNPYLNADLGDGTPADAMATLIHEVAGHGYLLLYGANLTTSQYEQAATGTENSYRASVGLPQRSTYELESGQCLPVTQW